jgi:class 3 adenylate cyclase
LETPAGLAGWNPVSPIETLPSGLVTFLFTDIEGSTKLFRRLGDAYPPLLEQTQRRLAHGLGGARRR